MAAPPRRPNRAQPNADGKRIAAIFSVKLLTRLASAYPVASAFRTNACGVRARRTGSERTNKPAAIDQRRLQAGESMACATWSDIDRRSDKACS